MYTDQSSDSETDNEENAEVRYWLGQIKSGKKAAEKHWKSSRDAWEEYLGDYESAHSTDLRRRSYKFPIFWASIQTIQPALYSSTPVAIAEREIEGEDPDGTTAAAIAQRLAKYLIKKCPFDRVQESTRDDLILAAKCSNRVVFDVENYGNEKIYLQAAVDQFGAEVLVDFDGNPAPGEVEILEDPDGVYYEKPLEEPRATLIPLSVFDVIHTPRARHQEEVWWMGYKLCLTKREATEEFGKEVANRLAYGKPKEDGQHQEEYTDEPVVEVWELWDKKTKKVRWAAECYPDAFLRELDDPYELEGFFPSTPFVFGTKGPKNLYPVTDYSQLEDLISQMQGAYRRVCRLMIATRRRGIYDGNVEDLAALNSDFEEAEYLPAKDFQQLIDKGGLANVVQHFPVGELVSALMEMIQAIQTLEQFFFEMWGIPDIIRGTSVPSTTATEQKIKERYASLRFSSRQRQFQEQVRKGIELMVDLALAKFPDEYIAEIVGLQHLSPEHQARFPRALQILRSDRTRCIHIGIETDSTILVNEEEDRTRRTEITQSILGGLGEIARAAQLPPSFQAFVGKLLLYGVRGMRDAKELEDDLRTAIDQALQASSAPPPEPPPDPKMLELQMNQQQHQVDTQLKTYELQIKDKIETANVELEQQKHLLETEREEMKINLDAQTKLMELQIKQQKEATQAQLEAGWLEIEKYKMNAAAQTDEMKVAMERQAQLFQEQVEMYRLQLEAAAQRLDGYEKILEETRLAHTRPRKRRATVSKDSLGRMMIESEEEVQ